MRNGHKILAKIFLASIMAAILTLVIMAMVMAVFSMSEKGIICDLGCEGAFRLIKTILVSVFGVSWFFFSRLFIRSSR